MAGHHFGEKIDPEVASHLAAAMDQAPGPEQARRLPLPATEGQRWPDGNGKHRHLKDQGIRTGRAGHEAAVNAVHRTGRPEMPHSS